MARVSYRSRNLQPRPEFEQDLGQIGIQATAHSEASFSGFDMVILATNTDTVLLDGAKLATLDQGSVVVSLRTTSMVGEIAQEVYGRDDVHCILDHDLSRRFTPDMRRADDAGTLSKAVLLTDILNTGSTVSLPADKVTIVRMTGTPMQNLALLDLYRD